MSAMLRQVTLRRRTPRGWGEDVFWIDNALARVGNRVVDEDGVVWIVAATYGARTVEDVNETIEQWRQYARTLEGH